MSDWYVASGPASKELGTGLAKALNSELIHVESRIFPDGESQIRIMGDVRNRRIILVQSTYPPVDRHLNQALFMAHRISEDGGEVYGLFPYLAYARQDKEFLKGEVVSLGVIGHLLRSVGVKRVVTVDLHSVEGLGLFSMPAYSVSAIPLLAEYLKVNFVLKDPVAISPDFGASSKVEAFARIMGIDHLVIRKARDRVTGEVRVEKEELKVDGRDAVIVDDIISTGSTVEKAAALLRSQGARKIIAACVHPLIVGDALERMKTAGVTDLVGTNTLPNPISKVDVTPALVSHFASLR